jgi:hypothetical protein
MARLVREISEVKSGGKKLPKDGEKFGQNSAQSAKNSNQDRIQLYYLPFRKTGSIPDGQVGKGDFGGKEAGA